MVPVDLGGRAALRHLKPLKPAEGSRSLPGGSISTVFLPPAPALMFVLYELAPGLWLLTGADRAEDKCRLHRGKEEAL